MEEVTIEKILHAEKILKPILLPTPLVKNEWLSNLYDCEVFLKLETEQPIGSFKIRGATYKISQLSDPERKKGIIAASAGNHAQGVAWGARNFKSDALIIMPVTAPLMKVQNTQSLGATVQQEGENYDECFAVAQKIAKDTGRIYVHAFHDSDVIAGQGTVGLEILSQCPEVDYVVTSIGGGGLAAGVGLVLKNLKPGTKLIACQAKNAASMVASLKNHSVTQSDFKGTFADGISVKFADPELFSVLDKVVDSVFDADEEEIAMNVLRCIEKAKLVTEGSGAITLGALDRYKDEMKGKKVVLLLSGGNIDVNMLSRIIDRGLIRSGRKLKLKVLIQDRPGALSKLTALVAKLGANIIDVEHERSELSTRLDQTAVGLTLETRGADHSKQIIVGLEKDGNRVEILK